MQRRRLFPAPPSFGAEQACYGDEGGAVADAGQCAPQREKGDGEKAGHNRRPWAAA